MGLAGVIRRRGPWRTFKAEELATLELVDFFDHRRLLRTIGNIASAETEQRYLAMPDDIPMAAQLKPNGLRQSRCGSISPRQLAL